MGWEKYYLPQWRRPPIAATSTMGGLLRRWKTCGLLWGAGLFVYGIAIYPTAPIRPHQGRWIDKGKNVRTRAEYEAFLRWQGALLFAFPAMFWTVGCVDGATKPMSRKKR